MRYGGHDTSWNETPISIIARHRSHTRYGGCKHSLRYKKSGTEETLHDLIVREMWIKNGNKNLTL
jgi:hypothetical protein